MSSGVKKKKKKKKNMAVCTEIIYNYHLGEGVRGEEGLKIYAHARLLQDVMFHMVFE